MILRRSLPIALSLSLALLPQLSEAHRVVPPPGFSIDRGAIDPSQDPMHGSFIVAGCVPQSFKVADETEWGGLPPGPKGSFWAACNDLDFVKDKVKQSKMTSCLDIYEDGVVEGFFIKEVNNRTWESFRISCKNLKKDGTLGGKRVKAPFLFNYEKDGTLYSTAVPKDSLAFGIFEVENALELRESLLAVGISHQSAAEIFDAGQDFRAVRGVKVTPRVPKVSPLTTNTESWGCPPGMVLTGAAIGHIPNGKGKHTRPVYILGECRRLLFSG